MEKAGIAFAALPGTAVRVLTSPAAFFQEMPKTGGFVEPLVFLVAMGVVGGLVQSIVSILGLRVAAGMMTGMASVVIAPILIAIFGFIGAAILFVIWKLLGSQQSYETAYRCNAYLGVLAPILALLNLLPYVGGALGIAIVTYYIVQASVAAHGIASTKAWAVFGAIGAIFIVASVGAGIAARKMASKAETFQEEMGKSAKGMQEQLEKIQKEAEKIEKKANEQGR